MHRKQTSEKSQLLWLFALFCSANLGIITILYQFIRWRLGSAALLCPFLLVIRL